ncbi:MAG: hypothetical protein RLZZ282_149 [Verrucomicrobiota bacterium]
MTRRGGKKIAAPGERCGNLKNERMDILVVIDQRLENWKRLRAPG